MSCIIVCDLVNGSVLHGLDMEGQLRSLHEKLNWLGASPHPTGSVPSHRAAQRGASAGMAGKLLKPLLSTLKSSPLSLYKDFVFKL